MIANRTTTLRAGETDDGDTELRDEMLESRERRVLRGITYGDC
jgi:hypothetical protein